MHRRQDPIWQRLSISLVISACIVFVSLWLAIPWLTPDANSELLKPLRSPSRQTVTLLTEADVRTLMANKPKVKPPKPKEEQKPEEKKIEKAPGQVVQIPPPKREETPEDTPLVSEYNSKVEKQTVSKTNTPPSPKVVKGPEVKISPGDDPTGDTRRRPKQASVKKSKRRKGPKRETDGKAAVDPSEKLGQKQAQKDPSPRWQDEVPGPSDLSKEADGTLQAQQERREAGDVGGNGPLASAGGPEDYRALLPTMGPEDREASTGSIDYLEDVEDGPETQLNTREYKYAWFFNRVKNQVQQRWRPGQAYRRRDPYGRVHGRKDRVTIVEVTLNKQGGLEDIFIQRDSGVAFLDEVAIQAFRQAQPFPNPPAGLQGDDGLITFKFMFYLELNRPGLQFLR